MFLSGKELIPFIIRSHHTITELARWQQQGYTLLTPVVKTKKYAIEEIR
jgi:hypothetical protein